MLADQSVRGHCLFLLRTGDPLYFILSTININKNPRFVYKNKAGVLCEGKSDGIGYTGLRGLFLRGNVSFQNFAALHYYVAPRLIC